MADIIIGNLPNPATTPLTGAERVPMDQRVGGTIAATALTPGLGYAIVTLGSTNWTACGVPAGVTPAVGLVFTCSAVGTGTGTAQQVETVDAAASDIAALAGGAISSAVAAHEAAANPHPNYTTQAEVEGIIAALTHLDVSITGGVTQHVRNDSGAPMAAGTPYHVVGAVGDTTRVRVVPSRADDAGTMPANGILQGDLTATGANADGHGVVSGVVSGLNTSGGIEGATIWVGLTGGISTNRPASNPQPIGTLGRIHASTGTLSVAVGPVLSTVAFTGAYADISGRPPEISQGDAEAGSATTFSLWTAQRWRQAAAAWWQTVSSALGRSLVAAADAPAARTILGLGTAAPLDVAASGNATTSQVVRGDDTRLSDARTPTAHTQAASTISDSTATGRALLTAADAPAARSAISAAGSGAITGSGLTMATARILARFTAGPGAVEETPLAPGFVVADGILYHEQWWAFALAARTSDAATGTNVNGTAIPYKAQLLAIQLDLSEAPAGADFVVDLNKGVGGTSVLSTKLSIDAGETNSATAAVSAVISDSEIPANTYLSWDIDQVGATAGSRGKGPVAKILLRRVV